MTSNVSSLVGNIERRLGIVGKTQAVCPEHGVYQSSIFQAGNQSGCPSCAVILQSERDRRALEAQRAAVQAEKLEAKMGSALIPKRFMSRDFDGFKAETPKQLKNLATCREYAAEFEKNFEDGRCLLLLGKPGTGKTHLAAAIARYVMLSTKHVAMYRTVSSVLQYVKGSYGERDYTESEAFASLENPGLLILDEIGATKPTEFEKAVLFEVINRRYENQKPTIVISNLMPSELSGALGERCVDRLREGGGKALVFDWESARA